MEIITAAVKVAFSWLLITPAVVAAEKSTKANSPPCAKSDILPTASLCSKRVIRATTYTESPLPII